MPIGDCRMKNLQTFRAMVVRFAGLFRRKQREAEMSEEMRGHIDTLVERNLAAGMPPDEARYAALRAFGGVAQIAERARDERRSAWGEQVLQDLRYAVRQLRKTPSFTITAVLTLALGVGVNAALFTVYNTVALRPLPVKDPDGLIKIAGQSGRRGGFFPGFSHAEYLAYQEGNHVLAGLVAINEANASLGPDSAGGERDPMFEGRDPGTVPVQWVSGNYFEVLGAEMKLGRSFAPEECQSPGSAPVVVLSHLFWERHLHRDPNVLGTTLTLGRRAYSVIGVAAPEFAGQQPAPPAGWLPLTMWGGPADYGPKGAPAFRLIGRLRPGVTEQQAKADLDVIAARRAREFPGLESKDSVRLERGMRFVNIPLNARTLAAMTPLVLGFVMVLVIACTNVANLLLARGVTRQQEIGVRLSLGASRGRVLRQLLTENLLLCALGAAVGLGLALWTLQILQPIVLGQLPPEWAMETRRWHFLKAGPDLRVAAFTVGLTLIAALAAGLLPALHAAGANVSATLKNDGTVFGRRVSQSRLRNLLVISQVAVCLMLLSCAGLLARNLFELRQRDLGFDSRAVFSVGVAAKIAPSDRGVAFGQALDTLQALPGVQAVGLAYRAPLLSGSGTTTLVRAVEAASAGGPAQDVRYCFVTPGFFETFGIPLNRGRGFTAAEAAAGARLIVVSESVARRFWPGQDAIGKAIAISEAPFAGRGQAVPPDAFRECEVIGVARDITSRVGEAEHELMYFPFVPGKVMSAPGFVRPRIDSPAALAEMVRAADAAGLTLQFTRRMSDYLDQEMLPFLGLAVLSGALGALAMAMAAVGLYGVMAFSVNQRVREIGIRVALGATAERVVGLFVRQGMRLVVIGLVVGLGGGALFAKLLAKILYGLGGAFDPVAFGVMTLLFSVIALLACWLPARRAAKVDPIVALRAE